MSYSVEQAKYDLSEIDINEPLKERMLKVTSIITKYMEEHTKQISDVPIVVGGLAMEIYTNSEYTTRDIDLVSTASIKLKELLSDLGFKKERIYIYDPLKIAVDIVDETIDPMDYDDINKIELDNSHIYSISKEGLLFNRALDYTYEDNKVFSVYLIANSPDDIDFEKVKNNLFEIDRDAATAFEEWVKSAQDSRH